LGIRYPKSFLVEIEFYKIDPCSGLLLTPKTLLDRFISAGLSIFPPKIFPAVLPKAALSPNAALTSS
jgi:hypothetical protein